MVPLRLLLALAGLLIAGQAGLAAATGTAARWQPGPELSWQVQFSGPIDTSVAADVFDLDLFDTAASLVAEIHAHGRRAVCYINAGAWEDWRPDAGRYPAAVKGRPLDGWPGEQWLDIRRLNVLRPILHDRLSLCRARGFDAVEFDNVDGYSNQTGFPLTRADQLRFDRWLAGAAHEHGLAVGLKNTLGLAGRLAADFDFALVEQCFQYRECSLTRPFTDAGKPVVVIEYSLPRPSFCARAAALGVTAMRKHRALDAWRRAC